MEVRTDWEHEELIGLGSQFGNSTLYLGLFDQLVKRITDADLEKEPEDDGERYRLTHRRASKMLWHADADTINAILKRPERVPERQPPLEEEMA